MTRAEFIAKQHEAIKMIDGLSDKIFASKDIGSNQKIWIGESLKDIWLKVFEELDPLKLDY